MTSDSSLDCRMWRRIKPRARMRQSSARRSVRVRWTGGRGFMNAHPHAARDLNDLIGGPDVADSRYRWGYASLPVPLIETQILEGSDIGEPIPDAADQPNEGWSGSSRPPSLQGTLCAPPTGRQFAFCDQAVHIGTELLRHKTMLSLCFMSRGCPRRRPRSGNSTKGRRLSPTN